MGRRLGESLDIVRRHVEAGTVSGETLVLLCRMVEDAAQRHDADELHETLRLAQQIVTVAGETLRPEAERLVTLCAERIAQVPSAATPLPDGEVPCPGCGRPVPASAVRCRSCGTLLV